MDTPAPRPPSSPAPSQGSSSSEAQIRAWLKLQHEVAELHARLEYLKLMVSLGVR
jgi:hypothetical protein